MTALIERRHGLPLPLPELIDWLESGFPTFTGRMAPGLHGIRIEAELVDGMYIITAELPGVDVTKDVEITVEGDVLTLRAERTEQSDGKRHSEFRYGTFARAVRLPAGARGSETTAQYKDGILTVKVPVPEMKTGSHTVKVEPAP